MDDQLLHYTDPTAGYGKAVSLRASQLLAHAGCDRRIVAKFAYDQADIHINSYLDNFSIDYRDETETYAAEDSMPLYKVNKASNVFAVWPRTNANVVIDARVGPRDMPQELLQSLSSGSYKVVPYAVWTPIPNDLIAQADAPLDLMGQASRSVKGALEKSREGRVANKVMDPTQYDASCTVTLSGTNQWSYGAGSIANVVTDIQRAMRTAAVKPNVMVMSQPVWDVLRAHPTLVSTIAGVNGNQLTMSKLAAPQQVAELFGLEKVVISDVRSNTTPNPFSAAGTYGFMWGKGCALLRVSNASGINSKGWGKTFRHVPLGFTTIFDQRQGMTGTTWIKGYHSDAEQVTASDMGYLIDAAIA